MRVLHVLDHSLPLHSGYTFRTLSILKAQRDLGWQTFHVTTPKHVVATADEEEFEGWHFFRTRMRAVGTPAVRELALMHRLQARLAQIVERVEPDLLHVHSPVLNAIPALRVARRNGLPLVYEVRAFWEDAAVDHGTMAEWGIRYRATRGLETWAMRRADHVTTICQGLKSDIVARGIAEDRVSVIPNAVAADSFVADPPVDVALKAELGLDGKTVIGYIGSFYAYEGLDLLLNTMPSLLARRPDLRLLLVGGGPEEMRLAELARSLRIVENVRFVGRVGHEDIHRYYAIVDLFVYPRRSMRLTELVTPLKPLEAMAQTRLVIASDVGGHRELIRDGETGVLFKAGDANGLADAVIGVLGDPERARSMRAEARRFVEQERTWQNSVGRYRPVFERLQRDAQRARARTREAGLPG